MDTLNPNRTSATPAPTRPKPGKARVAFWFTVVAILLALVVGGLYAFEQFRAKAIANFFATNAPPPSPVVAVTAETESMPRYLEGIGTLAAVHQVTISPEVGGRVVKIMFEAGADVKKGMPLVQLDDGPERGDLALYQAQVRLAEANLQRTETLARQDFATRQTVDQNKSALDQANAGIAKTQAIIAQKQIVAPFDGKLGVRKIDLGQYLQAGTAVVTLTDLDTLYANFTLPEQDRARLEVNQDVQIRVDAYPDRVFAAKVTTIEPQIDPQTRTMRVQATLSNSDHALLPGMYANARVVLPPLADVVTVPETAVYSTAYGDSAYVIEDNGIGKDGKPAFKAVQAFVTTGTRHDGKIAVLKGLKAGDRVVKDGQNRLHNGAAVAISDQPGPLKIPETPPRD